MLGLVQGKVGEPLTFEGYADDYDKAIVAMEFSLDGGTTWTRHATEGAQAGRVLSWTFVYTCLLYTSPSPRDGLLSRMPSSA